jgi:Fic family protein
MAVRRTPGTQLAKDRSGELIYKPSDGEDRLRTLLGNWERFLHNETDYYRLLLAVTRDQAWEPWVLFMLKAVEETSRWTTAKIAAIRQLAEHTTEHVRTRLPKIYSRELVDVIFEQPYCRIGNLVDKQIGQRQAASRYLKELVALGVLREMTCGKEKLFVHPKLMQLLSRDSNEFQANESV